MLIDTHAHLTDSRYDLNSADFEGVSLTDIIGGMERDGIEKIISIGYDVATSIGAAKIAEQNAAVYFAVGIHPSEAGRVISDLDACIAKIENISCGKKCVAIGEIGLDYHYDGYDPTVQKAVMLAQMRVAKSRNLPVIFHVRDSFGDSMDIIKSNLDLLPRRGVMHCYSGSYESARELVNLGFYISFSGSLTFKNAVNLREAAKLLPRERILIETDCPYLAPAPHRGKTNYPKFVNLTAQTLADIWECSLAETERVTTKNAYELFKMEAVNDEK